MFTFLTEDAVAPMAGGGSMIFMIVIMFAIFYFFIIRPENQKKKKTEEMRSSLSLGDEITTILRVQLPEETVLYGLSIKAFF